VKLEVTPGSVVDLTRQQQRFAADAKRRDGCASVPLPNGLRGWTVQRSDQCLQAAVATATQTPLDQVPDAHIDERLAAGADDDELAGQVFGDLERWAHGRGLEMLFEELAVPQPGLWIGLVKLRNFGMTLFADHCLVLAGDTIAWDPCAGIPVGRGLRVKIYSRLDITASVVFQPNNLRELIQNVDKQ
jgi:hypothetical protein